MKVCLKLKLRIVRYNFTKTDYAENHWRFFMKIFSYYLKKLFREDFEAILGLLLLSQVFLFFGLMAHITPSDNPLGYLFLFVVSLGLAATIDSLLVMLFFAVVSIKKMISGIKDSIKNKKGF
jgi:hypothetical protein